MRASFVIVTDLAPQDACWGRAVAMAAAVADAAAPILGFRPEVTVASLAEGDEPGALSAVLAALAGDGCTHAFLLPAILELSVFQRQALVEIVRGSQRRSPGMLVHYDEPDPRHRHLVQALAEALWEVLAGSEVAPARLGV